jgi:hypothetical protein
MLGTRACALTVTTIVFLMPGSVRAREQNPPPVAEAARQVTEDPVAVRAHATPVVAVDPRDARVIAMGEGEAYGGRCFLHVSKDAGSSWTTGSIPQPSDWPNCTYANFGPVVAIAFGRDGTLYYAFSGQNPKTYQSRMFLARTTDLGATWQTTALPWVEPNLDKGQLGADALPTIALDPANPGRVAVGWMTNNGTWNVSDAVLQGKKYYYDVVSRPYVAVSQDGGKSFSAAVDAAGDYPKDPKIRGWMNEPHLAFGNHGELFAFFGENTRPLPEGSTDPAPPAHLWLSTSTDGGRTFKMQAIYTRSPKKRDWLGQPSPALDRRTGDLYVVWDEQPAADAPARVAFMSSNDGGKTWTTPRKLNDVDPQRTWNFCEFCPSMDVSPQGRIDVAWYDWRNDPAFDPTADKKKNAFQDVYYTYSTDGGHTWAPNAKVTDRMIDRRLGVFKTMGLHGNVGLASSGGAALIAWDDTRNSNEATQSQDVYFTQMRFTSAGAAEPAGSTVLSGLLGAGGALAAGGLVLLLLGLMRRRRLEGAPAPSV